MNLGRNDPCPCGSSQKYKKCCLVENQPDQNELKKERWAEIQSGLVKKLMRYINKEYGPPAINEAWAEFYLWETDEDFDPVSLEVPIFMPWFFYGWYPDAESTLCLGAPDIPPALSLAESGKDISHDEEQYLIECYQTGFSFYEILDVVPNKLLKLKNILTEEYHHALEKKGSRGIQKGDIFFGKVISIDDIDIIEACSTIIIRPKYKIQILELRKHMGKQNQKITHKVLHNYGTEILEVYRDIYENMTNPPIPILTNTDGHLLIPHKLIFEIDDPIATFDALHRLCFNYTKEELLEDASYDKIGQLKSVEFPWLKRGNKKLKGCDNTVLSHIKIDGTKMTVVVNSKERAKMFQAEIKKRMPTGWKLKSTLIDPIENHLGKKSAPTFDELERKKVHEELMKIPEVRGNFEKMMKAHWDSWVHEPLPALGGLKPVDAVKNKDGREALDALLTQLERDAEARPMIGQTAQTIRDVRARLGMS